MNQKEKIEKLEEAVRILALENKALSSYVNLRVFKKEEEIEEMKKNGISTANYFPIRPNNIYLS